MVKSPISRRSRIEAVETVQVDGGWRTFVFVVVVTEGGLRGVGEATLEYHDAAVVAAIDEVARVIRGLDAMRIEDIWQRLYRGARWRGGPVLMTAISGIDQALWDIKGKLADLPVYELLGGACREYVALYANGPRGSTPDELAASAAAIVQRGFDAMKLLAAGPVLAVDDGDPAERTREAVGAIREAVGPRARIAVDAHGQYSPAMAIRLARNLEPLGVWFLEEPVLPERPAALAQVGAATSIPLALGERLFSRWEFQPFLETGFLALAQPDLAHCGGVSEGRRIAALAELYHAGFAPHNPLSPVNTLVSAHLALATPNFVALEYVVDDVDWAGHLVTEPLDIRAGRLFVPDRPGFGVDLDMAVCRAHPPSRARWPLAFHADGGVAES